MCRTPIPFRWPPRCTLRKTYVTIGVLALVSVTVIGLDASVGLPGGVLHGELLRQDPAPQVSSPLPTPLPITQPVPAGPVLEPASGPIPPDPAALGDVLRPLLDNPNLGRRVGVSVIDVVTGNELFTQSPAAARTPASTTKLLTAAATLQVLGSRVRLTTSTVQMAPAQGTAAAPRVVLVGGGDPSLRDLPGAGDPSLKSLARATAKALAETGTSVVRIGYDDSLFRGPTTSPAWPAEYVESGVVGPVTALSVDEAHVADPSREAGLAFVRQLERAGVTVRGPLRALTASATAQPLAEVRSRPVSELVQWMLTESDNDYAEAFGHLVAVSAGDPATFSGAAAATEAAIRDLGVDTSGVALSDASGLARDDRIPAATLTALLATTASPDRPELSIVLGGLPVAAFTGTLQDRFVTRPESVGAGVVRAKTGTLTGVSTLAGTVADRQGRVLAFAFLADRTTDTLEARAALDRAAAALAACGCR